MNNVPSLFLPQVLYYPSTQQTVDFLLEKGADVTAKNQDGATPASLAEDKDLKQVLKDLRRAAGRKKLLTSSVDLYKNTPELKRKVWDRALAEARAAQPIMVVYNAPVAAPCSPGLLKRRRDPADQVCLLTSYLVPWSLCTSVPLHQAYNLTTAQMSPSFSPASKRIRWGAVEERAHPDAETEVQRCSQFLFCH